MSEQSLWSVLGVEETKDRKAIRTAYAQKLKSLDVDGDIDGFAQLRGARDEALWLAKQVETPPENAPPEGLTGDGMLLGEGADEQDQIEQSPASDFAERGWSGEEAEPERQESEPLPAEDGITADFSKDSSAPDQNNPESAEIEQVNQALAHIYPILLPDGEQSAERLGPEEIEIVRGHLQELIDLAHSASIDLQAGIEGAIAHCLASAWPRSSTLLEMGAEAFHWGQNAGLIDEDPAVNFLNLQLASMDFMEQLDRPIHRWHGAWNELQQSGARPWRPFGGPRVNDINDFLIHVRTTHPQIEDYLDGQRVESWLEKKDSSSPWVWAFGILFALFVLSRIGEVAGESDPSDAPPTIGPIIIAGQEWNPKQKQDLLNDLFGAGVVETDLANTTPTIAEALTRITDITPNSDEGTVHALERMREIVRFQSFRAAGGASFEDLIAIKQYRLDLLRIVNEQAGTSECVTTASNGFVPESVTFSDDFQAKESALYRKLLDGNAFSNGAEIPSSASIPGWLVTDTMTRAGITNEQFTAASQNNADDSTSCAYQIALLESALRRPGDISAELLRMI